MNNSIGVPSSFVSLLFFVRMKQIIRFKFVLKQDFKLLKTSQLQRKWAEFQN